MVPGTSNYWPYHKDLVVFCLKFRLAPVFEYLNYYYNITNNYWNIPEKIQAGGFENILLSKKNLKFLGFSFYPWKFQSENEDLWKFNMIFFQYP